MNSERFGSNYWRNLSVRKNAQDIGVEGRDEGYGGPTSTATMWWTRRQGRGG